MRVERLTLTRWHYLVMGVLLLSIIFASALWLSESLQRSNGVSVASRFAEGHLYPDYDFCFLNRTDELEGKRANELSQPKSWPWFFSSPSIVSKSMRQSY